MAASIASLFVTLGINAAQFNSGLAAATASLQTAGASMNTVGKKMAGIGAAMSLAITAPVVAFGIASSKAAIEAANALGQVEAALKSTGDRAGFTSKQLADMATGLMNSSLFDDDDIMKDVSAGMIRFGNVTGDVFARAQQLAVDYASRTGKSLSAATTLMGKALDNPVKGMAALEKAGVSLSNSQKETIKNLVETGKRAEAQQLILKALETRFKGAAQAAQDADPYNRLQDAINTLSETFGGIINTQIIPLVSKLNELAERFNNLSPAMQGVIVSGVGIAAAMGPLITIIGGVMTGASGVVTTFLSLRTSMAAATVGTTGLASAMALLRTAMAAVGGPIGIAIAAVLTAVGVAVGFLIAKNMKAAEAERQVSARVREKADALRAAKEAADQSRIQTGTLTDAEMEAAKYTAALTGQTDLLAKSYYRAAAAAKYLALTQNANELVQAESDLKASEDSAARAEERARRRARGPVGSGDGRQPAPIGFDRMVQADLATNPEVARARQQANDARAVRDAKAQERRDLKAISLDDAAWTPLREDTGGESGGSKSGRSADDIAREAEERRRALEDYNAELELQEAQLRGDQDRVRILERQGDVRLRTRTLIDQDIIKDKNAAAAEAERVEVRLDALREEARIKDEAKAVRSWTKSLYEIDGRNDLVAKIERQEKLEERIAFWNGKNYDLVTATTMATKELEELDLARAEAAERINKANVLDFEIEKARLRGDTRGENRLSREAKVNDLTERYQNQALNPLSPTDARSRAEAEMQALDDAALQGKYRDFVKGGFQAAMDGDLAGFAQGWIKDWASKGLEESLNSLADILMSLFKNIDWGQGPAGIGGGGGGINLGSIGKSIAGMFGKIPGFATGGSFKVGGAGGIDSKLVSMRLTPGEMVDVRRPGQLQAANNNAPLHFNLSGAVVTQDLLDQMNAMANQSGGNALRGARTAVPADRAKSDKYKLNSR